MRTVKTFHDDRVALFDLETESAADLRRVGGRVYAADPTTRVTMMVVYVDGVNYVWINSAWVQSRRPVELQLKPETIRPDGLVGPVEMIYGPDFPFGRWADRVWVAHNAIGFDAHVWQSLGFPGDRFADSAYFARASGLPGALDGVGEMLGAGNKDAHGKGVLKKYFRPGSKTPAKFAADVVSMVKYALQDLHILKVLWDETAGDDSEDDLIDVHEIINDRGVAFDLELCRIMATVSEESVARDGDEIAELTGGTLTPDILRSGPKVHAWLNEHGVNLPNLQAGTVDRFLASPEDFADDDAPAHQIDPVVFPVLRLRRSATRITGAKLLRAAERSGQSTRLQDLFVYHGAHTGRWTSSGLQVHNLPRGVIDPREFLKLKTYDEFVAAVRPLRAVGRTITVDDVLSAMIRPLLRAADGYSLLIADYAQVECRGLAWVAGETGLLDTFEAGRDLYKEMASRIFGVDVADVTKPQRQVGKVVVLGCGYGLGDNKLGFYAANQGIDLTAAGTDPRTCVEAFRNAYTSIAGAPSGTWEGRTTRRGGIWKAFHEAVHDAIDTGDLKGAGRCLFQRIGRDLVCQLPSGRELVYRRARIEDQVPLWGGDPRPTLIYDGPRGRSYLYGGRIAENVVQALCRDLLADALIRAEHAGLRPVLHVHDEIVCETSPDRLPELLTIMSTPPAWASDFPLKVEGFASDRYLKDGDAVAYLRGVPV